MLLLKFIIEYASRYLLVLLIRKVIFATNGPFSKRWSHNYGWMTCCNAIKYCSKILGGLPPQMVNRVGSGRSLHSKMVRCSREDIPFHDNLKEVLRCMHILLWQNRDSHFSLRQCPTFSTRILLKWRIQMTC